jgi:chemotaxis signal transduction protein
MSVEHHAPLARAPLAFRGASEYLVFALGAQTYAIAAEQWRACLSLPRLTALDDTPHHLLGAFDLRGELTPVVSPAVLEGAALAPARSGDLLVVVDAAGHPLALHADTVLGLERLRYRSWCASSDSRSACMGAQVRLSGGRASCIDPAEIPLIAEPGASAEPSADARLRAFERLLDPVALSLLEVRAERYRGLADAADSGRRLGGLAGHP